MRVLLLAAGTPAVGAPGGTEGGAPGGAAAVAPDGAASGREAVKLARQMEALSMEVGKYIKTSDIFSGHALQGMNLMSRDQ
jgi:hypothetical protein